MNLKAYWNGCDELVMGPPDVITWEDGAPATMSDYESRLDDTYSLSIDGDGRIVKHMLSDVVAEVYFDRDDQSWALRGEGVEKSTLDLQDPKATDLQIMEVVQSLPTVYRILIFRF